MTATDDDGTLVNWIEVEPAKTEEELKAEWAMDAKPAAKHEDRKSYLCLSSCLPLPHLISFLLLHPSLDSEESVRSN